jgi:hypothetical protein
MPWPDGYPYCSLRQRAAQIRIPAQLELKMTSCHFCATAASQHGKANGEEQQTTAFPGDLDFIRVYNQSYYTEFVLKE